MIHACSFRAASYVGGRLWTVGVDVVVVEKFPIGVAGVHQPLHRESREATSHLPPTPQNLSPRQSTFRHVSVLTVTNGVHQSARKRRFLISINTSS
jgi:hypothetical protein